MKKKFDAVYFKSMNYTWENVAFIKENFNLTILSNVKNLSPNKNNNVEVLFAPFELRICESSIRYFDKLKVVVSNTTSIPHIDVNFCKKQNIKIASLHNEQTYLKRITPTAEHTFGLILACYRNIIPAFRDVKMHSPIWRGALTQRCTNKCKIAPTDAYICFWKVWMRI